MVGRLGEVPLPSTFASLIVGGGGGGGESGGGWVQKNFL